MMNKHLLKYFNIMGWMDDDKEQKYEVFAKVFHFNWKQVVNYNVMYEILRVH